MNSPRISGRAQLFIVLLILSQALMSLGQDFLTNGLVAYYPFNGNANDKSGNGNHGLVQGATLTTDRHGVPGRAYYFDGVDDIILATVPVLPIGGQPRTVSIWAKAAPDVFCGTTLVQW